MKRARPGLGSMDAQRLAGDDDEQSSGYKRSGSPAGVRKCARVREVEQRRKGAGVDAQGKAEPRFGHGCS